MAGLFFCLAPTRCRAFILPCHNTSPYKRLQRVFVPSVQLYRPRRKTAHRALQVRFRPFAVFCRCCVSVYPAILHHLHHAGAHHSAVTPPVHTRYQTQRRTPYRSAQPPYYNKVYKGAGCAPVMDARRCSTSQTMPARRRLDASHARRLAIWHRSAVQGGQPDTLHPAGQSSSRDAAGGAELLAATAVSLFGLSPDS